MPNLEYVGQISLRSKLGSPKLDFLILAIFRGWGEFMEGEFTLMRSMMQNLESSGQITLKGATVDPPIGFWQKTGVWQFFLRSFMQNLD